MRGKEADEVVEFLRRAEKFQVPRLLPPYNAEAWKLAREEAVEFVQSFQRDAKVQELISKLKEIGKN